MESVRKIQLMTLEKIHYKLLHQLVGNISMNQICMSMRWLHFLWRYNVLCLTKPWALARLWLFHDYFSMPLTPFLLCLVCYGQLVHHHHIPVRTTFVMHNYVYHTIKFSQPPAGNCLEKLQCGQHPHKHLCWL